MMDEFILWIFFFYYLFVYKGVYDIGYWNSVLFGGFYYKIYCIGGGDSILGIKVFGFIIIVKFFVDLKEFRRFGDDIDERLGLDLVDEFKIKIEICLLKLIFFKMIDGGESVIYYEYNLREFDKVVNGLKNENKVFVI